MKTTTYNTLHKIAAGEKSWWDDYGHKLVQAAIPGLGVWGLGRLLGLDNGIAAALGLGAGAVGWHSGDWAKDWFKKKKSDEEPTTQLTPEQQQQDQELILKNSPYKIPSAMDILNAELDKQKEAAKRPFNPELLRKKPQPKPSPGWVAYRRLLRGEATPFDKLTAEPIPPMLKPKLRLVSWYNPKTGRPLYEYKSTGMDYVDPAERLRRADQARALVEAEDRDDTNVIWPSNI